MIASNVKPSVATFSILIRLYAQCVLEFNPTCPHVFIFFCVSGFALQGKHWDEAVDLLRQETT